MEFGWSGAQEAYRAELRELLRAHLPDDWWANYASESPSNPALMKFARGFAKALAAKGHVVSHWPKEYGGRDSEPWEHIILSEEMWGEGEPRSSLYLGSNWAGPVIMLFGTDEQKQLHLKRIADGEVFWCQGFSEPEAGSDLANLRTRAEHHADGGYVIDGRKIWTSYAHSADWIFLLARLDQPGRSGVTCFMIPMSTPGISVRTIQGLQSAHELHEVTFDRVRVPESARLGAEGRGWEVVTAALNFERIGAAHYALSARALERAVELLKERGSWDDPQVQAQAASCLAMLDAAKLLVYKVIDERVKKKPPAASTNIARLAMIRSNNAVADFIASYLPDALTEKGDGRLRWAFKFAMVSGIASGAAEVQMNLISGRQLGLPKGP